MRQIEQAELDRDHGSPVSVQADGQVSSYTLQALSHRPDIPESAGSRNGELAYSVLGALMARGSSGSTSRSAPALVRSMAVMVGLPSVG